MNNLAEVVKFERGEVVQADIENGYDRLAHTLTDALAKNNAKLSGCEYQVVFAIISKTYRFHKKNDWIAICQIEEITGMKKAHVCKTLKSLNDKNIITKDGKKIGINKAVSEWKVNQSVNKKTNEKLTNQLKQVNRLDNTINQSVNKSKPIRPPQKKETNTKEIITKENARSKKLALPELPKFIPENSLLEFIEHRKQIKKPMTELALSKFIKKLEAEHKNGFSITELLDEAIANGWQTVYPPKKNNYQKPNRAENFSQRDYGEAVVRF